MEVKLGDGPFNPLSVTLVNRFGACNNGGDFNSGYLPLHVPSLAEAAISNWNKINQYFVKKVLIAHGDPCKLWISCSRNIYIITRCQVELLEMQSFFGVNS